MTRPTTAQGIYDLLLATTSIAAALGTYRLVDGTVIPAIAVLRANEQLPPGTVVEGTEIVITRQPGYAPRPLLTGETLLNPTWRIYVCGWESAATLQATAERIMALLPGATCSSVPGDAPGEGIGVIDQLVISWTNPTVSVEA